jgi:hypothetical protein
VLVELAQVEEGLEEVEHDMWLPLLDLAAYRRQFLMHLERTRLVAECLQRAEDVDLGLEIMTLLLAQRVEVVGGHVATPDENEHAKLAARRTHSGMDTRRL